MLLLQYIIKESFNMKKMSSKKLKNKQKYIIPGLLAILLVTAILLENKYRKLLGFAVTHQIVKCR